MKSGFVAILGRPNVGKSTLLNALLSKKVSIVSPKAQTTRDSIMGVLNLSDAQIVFVDTPGIFFGKAKLDSTMRKAAFSSSRDVDAILYLLDAGCRSYEEDAKIFSSIHSEAPRILILNKIDLIGPEEANRKKLEIASLFGDVKLIEASFKTNFGLKDVREAILPLLSDGPAYFPEGTITDKDQSYTAKEAIREKMLRFLRNEVPHQAAVRIDKFVRKPGGLVIEATVLVEKESHKAIVIGKGGAMVKKIAMSARQQLQESFHERILSLTIEVEAIPGWRDDPKILASLGYGQ